jgi:hypothetical protein
MTTWMHAASSSPACHALATLVVTAATSATMAVRRAT